MNIFYLPIEPYETRYTADWVEQFEKEFEKHGVNYKTIMGATNSTKVTAGGVLDACGTHSFKFTQLCTLIDYINARKVNNGDIVFFADLWFPGIESLFYIRNMLNIDFKICGIFHAGTYDKYDFTYRNGMRPWGKFLEASWFSGVDMIFVATEFHKKLLLSNSVYVLGLADKIKVTGLPFYANELRQKYPCEKSDDNILVFPHRCDAEKCPELFDALVTRLTAREVKFVACKTILETSSRDEYFKLLARSKVMVSFAQQETFGYSTLESMALGNIVVVPNKLSYVETVPNAFRYNSIEECFDAVYNALTAYVPPSYVNIEKWENSIHNMLIEMEKI